LIYERFFQNSVAAEVTRLISNAEGGMMNEEKAATDFVRFVSFLHSAFFLLHFAFRMSLLTRLHHVSTRQASAATVLKRLTICDLRGGQGLRKDS
jgi:hypothetical protein